MFDKNCKAKNCKNDAVNNVEGSFSEDIPSYDMGWKNVKFCSKSCKEQFRKDNSGSHVSWGKGEW